MKASFASFLVIALGLGAPFATAAAAPPQNTNDPKIEIAANETLLRGNRGLPADAGLALPHFDEPGDGSMWVLGNNYKARFDSRGLTFVPFLGSDAPKNYPVTFSIGSARVGSRELDWRADVVPQRDGSIITYHRGAFDEIFEVAAESIEHKFVFAERVGGGDLIMSIHTESELERASTLLATCFVNDRGLVSYGNATLVDARAKTMGSITQLVDDSIVILSPAGELDRAVFPLTVDPVITSFTVTSTVNTPEFPDTSYDLTTDTWLCVCQTKWSSSDHDILVSQFDASGNLLVSTWIDTSFDDWTKPRVANCNAQDRFMVVAQVNSPTSRVGARTYKATDASMSAQFQVNPAGSGTCTSPDIGGDDYPVGGPAFCVAYCEVGNGIWCSRVSPSGTVYPRVQLEFVPSNIPLATEPVRISKSNGHWSYGDQRWTVAWLRDGGTFNMARQVNLNGQPVTPPFQIGNYSYDFSISPLLDEYGPYRRYLVALFDGNGGIAAHFNGGPAGSSGWLGIDDNGLGKVNGRVETDGTRFFLVYSEATGYGDTNIYMSTIISNGNGSYGTGYTQTQSHVPVATALLGEITPSIATKHSSGGVGAEALCVWKRVAGTITKKGFTYTYPDMIFGAIIN